MLGKIITSEKVVTSNTNTFHKNRIFVYVFEIENNGYAVLRKELLIAPFVECCKTTTLGKY